MKCPYCGADSATPGTPCPFCGGVIESAAPAATATTVSAAPAELPPSENVLLGTIGALVGSLLGAASIVLFGQMGYVASLSGLILAFCTLKGYQILGKRLGTAGIVISIIIMAVMPFAAYLVSTTLQICRELGTDFMETFQLVMNLITSGTVSVGEILMDIAMIYLFVILGAFGTISNAIRANKQ